MRLPWYIDAGVVAVAAVPLIVLLVAPPDLATVLSGVLIACVAAFVVLG